MNKLIIVALIALSITQAKADYKNLQDSENTRIYKLLQQIKCESALSYDDAIFMELYNRALEIEIILYPDIDNSIVSCGEDMYKEVI